MSAQAMELSELFDPDFLSALQTFSLRLNRVQRGGRHADQKSMQRGQGLEFVDFKPYVPGDDLRAIDWTDGAGGPNEAVADVLSELVDNADRPARIRSNRSGSVGSGGVFMVRSFASARRSSLR